MCSSYPGSFLDMQACYSMILHGRAKRPRMIMDAVSWAPCKNLLERMIAIAEHWGAILTITMFGLGARACS